MASNYSSWFLLFIVSLNSSAATSAATSCTPIRGLGRNCSVVKDYDEDGLQLIWHDEKCQSRIHQHAEACPGQVEMRLTLKCSAGGHVCKGRWCGDSTNSTSYTINSLQSEDEGEYGCRTEDSVLFMYNLTVETGEEYLALAL